MGHWSRTKDFEENTWLYSMIKIPAAISSEIWDKPLIKQQSLVKASKDLLYLHGLKLVNHHPDKQGDSVYACMLKYDCYELLSKISMNLSWIGLKGSVDCIITWPWWEFTQLSRLSLQNSSYVIRIGLEKHIDFKPCPGNGTDHKTMMYQQKQLAGNRAKCTLTWIEGPLCSASWPGTSRLVFLGCGSSPFRSRPSCGRSPAGPARAARGAHIAGPNT